MCLQQVTDSEGLGSGLTLVLGTPCLTCYPVGTEGRGTENHWEMYVIFTDHVYIMLLRCPCSGFKSNLHERQSFMRETTGWVEGGPGEAMGLIDSGSDPAGGSQEPLLG